MASPESQGGSQQGRLQVTEVSLLHHTSHLHTLFNPLWCMPHVSSTLAHPSWLVPWFLHTPVHRFWPSHSLTHILCRWAVATYLSANLGLATSYWFPHWFWLWEASRKLLCLTINNILRVWDNSILCVIICDCSREAKETRRHVRVRSSIRKILIEVLEVVSNRWDIESAKFPHTIMNCTIMYLLGCWLYTTAWHMILDLQLEDLQNIGLCDVAYTILLLQFSS